MKREGIITAALYLHPHGWEEELDAIFVIAVESYPAEPYSWGGSRGLEHEVSARLLSWHRHGDEFDRADAVAIEGEARILEQEEWAAGSVDPDTFSGGDCTETPWLAARHGAVRPMAAE